MMAFERLEPFGGRQDDLRFGLVLSLMAARGGQKAAPGDFFASLVEKREPIDLTKLSPEEQEAVVDSILFPGM